MLTPRDLRRIAIHELGHYWGLRDAGVNPVAAKIIIKPNGDGRFNNGIVYGDVTQHIIMLCAAHEAEKICGVDGGLRYDSFDLQKIRDIAAANGLKDYHVKALRAMARNIVRARRREIEKMARQITGVGTWKITAKL